MSRVLSAAARQSAYAQQTGEVWAILLTVNHPSFTQPLRVSSDNAVLLPLANVRGTLSKGIEYPYLPFTITLPQQDESNVARATVVIDNIDRRIVEAARRADSALEVTVEVVLASSPDITEIMIEGFRIEDVNYDALTVSGDLSVEYFDLEPFSKLRYTPSGFPGMF